MKRSLYILGLLLLTLIVSCKRELVAPPIDSHYMKFYGEAGDDVAYDIQKLENGGGYVFAGYTTTAAGDRDAYIAMCDAYGYVLWSRTLGSELDDEFREIKLGDDIFVIGTSEDSTSGKDIRLVSYSYGGDIQIDTTYKRGQDQIAHSLDFASSSNYIIVGGSSSEASNQALNASAGVNPEGRKDFFLMKISNLDANRLQVLDRFQAGGSGDDEIADVDVQGDHLMAIGTINYTFTFDTLDNDNIGIIRMNVEAFDNPVFEGYGTTNFDHGSKILHSGGSFIMAGSVDMTISSENQTVSADPYIMKGQSVDDIGNTTETFKFNFEDTDVTTISDMKETSDGGYIIVGTTDGEGNGGKDVLLVKTDGLGKTQWYKTYGGAGDDKGYCVLETDDGGYIMAATTKLGVGEDITDQEIMILKVTSEGEMK